MADDDAPTDGERLSKTRMEAFSDGVLAIAITLLVLDLAIRPPGTPVDEFFRAWPAYLVYVISFLTVGAAWISHNSLTDDLDHVDRIFLRLNLLFLLTVSFLPFPTRLVGQALDRDTSWQRMAVTVFGLTVIATRLTFAALVSYSHRRHLRRPGAPDVDLEGLTRKFRASMVGYVGAIALGLVVPIAAIALFFATAVFTVVPFKAVARSLVRGRTRAPGD